MNVREYFDKEYGSEHIKKVIDMKDIESLYGLIEEFADVSVEEFKKSIKFNNMCLNSDDDCSMGYQHELGDYYCFKCDKLGLL